MRHLSGFAAAHPQLVGLKNYVRLFSDDGFWNSLVVTAFFVFGSSIVGQFCARTGISDGVTSADCF